MTDALTVFLRIDLLRLVQLEGVIPDLYFFRPRRQYQKQELLHGAQIIDAIKSSDMKKESISIYITIPTKHEGAIETVDV